ncbi:export associated protein [Streptomyces olivaceoviridis]|uniref:TerD family protein n=1 Tax=Streptomyces olivaceoviridis TaxID=1921 RepID=UPI0016731982|nr:TerD family protein [Streptomyces olivaceoviridis]GGY83022.1 export associated protein [Streptomyces olivaceoviridis]
MGTELVRGQNHPLSQVRLEIRISAGVPVLAGATLGDEHGTVHGRQWVAHPGASHLPGVQVPRQVAAEHRLAVDLAALPEAVHRVDVFIALPTGTAGPLGFGAVPAPHTTVSGHDGTELACYTLTGLDTETAVIALELYRRQGAWKVRAMGHGYANGLPALLADQGLPDADDLATAIQEAVVQGLPGTTPVPPTDRDTRPTPAPAPQATPTHQAVPTSQPATASPPASASQPATTSPPSPPASAPRPATASQSSASGPAEPPRSYGPRSPDEDGGPDPHQPGGPVDYTHPRRTRGRPSPPPSVADGQPARPVAGDAVGWSMEERLYNQVWGMFEDLARTTAAYRSAIDFADSRLEKELDQALADPRTRLGTAGGAAREAAHARRTQLAGRARAAFDRDLAQLIAEAEVVEPALPPAYARWDSPVWHAYRVPAEPPMALRLGDVHLPESAPLHIPLLVRLPLERGLWIDSGPSAAGAAPLTDPTEPRHLAMSVAVALAARLLAVHPAGEFAVQVVDPAGAGNRALLPLTRAGVLVSPPATGAAGVSQTLERLTRRVDLVQMAVRGGAAESLPADVDTAQQLLIVNDFPHGFDDRSVTRLRYLADEGPAVGVHLLLVADRGEATAYGPLLDPLWRSLLRLTPLPDDHLADPWIGHAWTYEPSLPPAADRIVHDVLTEVAGARTKR